MGVPGAIELLPPTPEGRRFSAERVVRLGDVDVAGELRLDAIARYLQDVATDDAVDAGLTNAMTWLVRRTLIHVIAPSELNESLSLTTFCTGAGRSWAERRTTIVGATGTAVDAVCLWVSIDPISGRPMKLGAEFYDRYGSAANGRVVSSRRSLPSKPTDVAKPVFWQFRQTDLDPFEHVNNAAQFAVFETLLAGQSRTGRAEIEYMSPVDLKPVSVLTDDGDSWIIDADRKPLTSLRWTPA
jgi:acyl-ACP thioesterase